jgi:hypothetical protein
MFRATAPDGTIHIFRVDERGNLVQVGGKNAPALIDSNGMGTPESHAIFFYDYFQQDGFPLRSMTMEDGTVHRAPEDGEWNDGIEDPDPVFWNKNQPNRTDENYNKPIIVWQNVGRFDLTEDEWKMKMKKFKMMIRFMFGLRHDIRWIGIVETSKTPGDPDSGGRLDVFFRVHNDDFSRMGIARRIDTGFRWFFDVVQNWPGKRIFPIHLRRMYGL